MLEYGNLSQKRHGSVGPIPRKYQLENIESSQAKTSFVSPVKKSKSYVEKKPKEEKEKLVNDSELMTRNHHRDEDQILKTAKNFV